MFEKWHDKKEFFKIMKKMAKYNQAKEGVLVDRIMNDGVVVEDPKKIAELVFKKCLIHDDTKTMEKLKIPTLHEKMFTIYEDVIGSNKAMGPDFIPDLFYSNKFLNENKDHILGELYKDEYSDIVEKHLRARIIMLNKKKAGIPGLDDIRPIAVQNTILKIMEMNVAQEIKDASMKTSEHQFGFKPRRSCSMAIVKLFEYLKALPKGNKKSAQGVMLVDFSKAYDRVDRNLLYLKMALAGIKRETIDFVKSIHANTKIVIGTEEKEVNTGIPQGSVISPFLFNIFIDDLLRELEKINQDFWTYADDIAFGFRNAREFHVKMKIIEEWSIRNGMKINVNKCELMIVNKVNDLNTQYKTVDVIKYLGIRIKRNLTLDDHYDICKKKMEMVIFKIANLATGCSIPSRMVQLFFVILKSVIDYGSIIYKDQSKDNDRKVCKACES